jgi:hypothetical protein
VPAGTTRRSATRSRAETRCPAVSAGHARRLGRALRPVRRPSPPARHRARRLVRPLRPLRGPSPPARHRTRRLVRALRPLRLPYLPARLRVRRLGRALRPLPRRARPRDSTRRLGRALRPLPPPCCGRDSTFGDSVMPWGPCRDRLRRRDSALGDSIVHSDRCPAVPAGATPHSATRSCAETAAPPCPPARLRVGVDDPVVRPRASCPTSGALAGGGRSSVLLETNTAARAGRVRRRRGPGYNARGALEG